MFTEVKKPGRESLEAKHLISELKKINVESPWALVLNSTLAAG
jgi:hypothetical protein